MKSIVPSLALCGREGGDGFKTLPQRVDARPDLLNAARRRKRWSPVSRSWDFVRLFAWQYVPLCRYSVEAALPSNCIPTFRSPLRAFPLTTTARSVPAPAVHSRALPDHVERRRLDAHHAQGDGSSRMVLLVVSPLIRLALLPQHEANPFEKLAKPRRVRAHKVRWRESLRVLVVLGEGHVGSESTRTDPHRRVHSALRPVR